jgi:hypothetical protein
MPALATTEANRLLDASLGVASYTAPTGSMKVALATSASSASAAGTEVTGGSYARQNVTFGSSSAGSTSNTGAVNFTAMPAATVTHVDLYDSNGTPRRAWYGALTASKTTASGDTLSFAIAALVASLA